MFVFSIIVILIAAVLLVLIVLVQNSKGGGLASGFASGNQVMGAPKTADFLEKATWSLAAVIVIFSIISVGVHQHQKHQESETGSAISGQVQQAMEDLQQSSTMPAFGEQGQDQEDE